MAGSNGTATTLRIGAESSAVVGNTPLVAVPRLAADLPGEVVAKLEFFNPGGSVKDRIGVAMIDAAERDGLIERGRSVIVEPTSGNTGIALALVAAARDYRLILTLPEGMSRERTALLRTYGAEVHETPSLGGMNEAVALPQRPPEGEGGLLRRPLGARARPRRAGHRGGRDPHGLGGGAGSARPSGGSRALGPQCAA